MKLNFHHLKTLVPLAFACCAFLTPAKGVNFGKLMPIEDDQQQEPSKQTLALTFGGGGFKSVADNAGVTAGLLGYLMKEENDTYTLETSGLYKDVDVLTSISGGSWFGALSIYSKKFNGLIDAMAKEGACPGRSKETIAKLYDDGFSKLFSRLKSPIPPSLRPRALLDDFLETDEDDLKGDEFLLETRQELKRLFDSPKLGFSLGDLRALFRLLIENGSFLSWKDVVNVVLQDISNDEGSDTIVNPKDFKEVDVTLGSIDVNEWAKSKTWAILTSIIYPDQPGKAIWHKGGYFKNDESRCEKACTSPNKKDKDECIKFTRYIKYQIDQSTRPKESGKQQKIIPARFSTVVGGGTNGEKPPLPFATEKFLKDVKIQYDWRNTDNYLPIREPKSSVGLMPSGNFDSTPVLGATAASSAFAGGLGSQCIPEFLNIETNVWFSPKREGKEAFDEPATIARNLWRQTKESRPTEETVQNIADLGLYELFDGGFTDPFGISTALAAGSTDIFTINTVAGARNGLPGAGPFFTTSVDLHFSDFNETTLVSPEIANVFKETTQQYHNLKNETSFHLSTQRGKNLLSGLAFIKVNVTTKENEYFGIEEGRKVNLYVVEPKSEIVSIGNGQDFEEYGKYVQEILEVMTDPSNSNVMKDMLEALNKSTTTIGSGNTLVKGEL